MGVHLYPFRPVLVTCVSRSCIVGRKRPLTFLRNISSTVLKDTMNRGIVIGVFTNKYTNMTYTESTKKIDLETAGKLSKLLTTTAPLTRKISNRLFYDLNQHYQGISVVDLGIEASHYSAVEELEQKKENIRCAIANGVKKLRDAGFNEIDVDGCDDPESAAEGAYLITHCYDELKDKSRRKPKITLNLHSSDRVNEWQAGTMKALSQNYARYLMEAPSNYMTPKIFAQSVEQKMSGLNVKVVIRDKSWIEKMKMGAFLSVAKGSSEPPLFLELDYQGIEPHERSVVLVGKGITFDSGGISLKPSLSMDKMRADMGGAACVAAAMYGAAYFKARLNIKGLIPLCENMPGGSATKPGDVVFAMNGKSIQVDNTDAEGRLILADALSYAKSFNPDLILDIATLTGSMNVALGSGCTGAFTNTPPIFSILQTAGTCTGDRIWKMPLFSHYRKQVTDCHLADLNNIGKAGSSGGSCTAAAFLKEFVEERNWIHLDIAGVMETDDQVPYLSKGMSGRPTRTLIEFLVKFGDSPYTRDGKIDP